LTETTARLDRRGRQDPLVRQVTKARPDPRDRKATRGPSDPPDRQVLTDLKGLRVTKALKETKDRRAPPDLRVLWGPPVDLALRETKVRQDRKGRSARKAPRV